MCGLVGMAGDIFASEKKAFRTLLELDVIRGRHSTGVAIVDRKDAVTICKEVGVPEYLYCNFPNEFDENGEVKPFNLRLLMGHNRWATTGAKTAQNAHPFHHGKIIGAHNGTLTRTHLNQLQDADKFDVDSEAIIYNLDKNGFNNTIDRLHGAWALTWYNEETKELNIIRNKERSLFYSWSDDKKTVFWASEGWMLSVALNREKIKHSPPKEFDEDTHYTLDVGGGSLKDVTFLYEEKKYTGFHPPVVQYKSDYWSQYGSHYGQTGNRYTGYQGKKDGNSSNNKTETAGNVVMGPEEFQARALRQKTINFSVMGERMGINNNPFLLCWSGDTPLNYEVRIYGDSNPRWEEWIASTGYYEGMVRDSTFQWNYKTNKYDRYVIIDPKTISKEKDFDEEGDVFERNRVYTVYQGEHVGLALFLERTKNGCAECGQPVEPREVDELVWTGTKQYVCPTCDKRHTLGL